ncbi:MAG: tyrosine-type recombinase/integrase [Chloroflexi bacterium]|nr:tyrosine-type recombinase/integrase [Chloroflexota bacterium]
MERYLEEMGVPADVGVWTPQHFARYPVILACLGLSPRAVERHLNSFRSFWRFLLRFDCVTSDPARRIQSPKIARRLPDYLSAAEMKALLRAAQYARGNVAARDRAFIPFLVYTGCRVSGVLSARWDQVDFGGGSVRIIGKGNKGNKERVIPLHPSLSEALCHYLQERVPLRGPHVFVNRVGKPMDKDTVRRILRRYTARAGIRRNVTVHMIRHGFGSLLARSNPLHGVQDVLGHSEIGTTSIYLHVEELTGSVPAP